MALTIMVTIIVLLAGLAFTFSFLLSLPREFTISESKDIAVFKHKAFSSVADLATWASWSPWLLHEPDATVKLSEKTDQADSTYSWDGTLVGSGKVTNHALTQDKIIEQTLTLLSPFKNTSKMVWTFETVEGEPNDAEITRVTWAMTASLPWYKRWMMFRLKTVIAADYRLGLFLLEKALLEAEAPSLSLTFNGVETRDDVTGLVEKFSGSFDDLADAIPAGFATLTTQMDGLKQVPSAPAFSAYTKTNLESMTTSCSMVLPLAKDVDDLLIENATTLNGGRFYKATYRGHYENLQYAWHAAISHAKMSKHKINMHRPALEVYLTNSKDTAPNESITEIFVPIR